MDKKNNNNAAQLTQDQLADASAEQAVT